MSESKVNQVTNSAYASSRCVSAMRLLLDVDTVPVLLYAQNFKQLLVLLVASHETT